MNRIVSLLLLVSLFLCPFPAFAQTVDKQFREPPEESKPGAYWYWLNNNVSKKGITADLEALKKAGVGTAMIGHIQNPGTPEGNVPALGPEWWDAVTHAVEEGDRLGVNVGMFNSPGWSQSGGPWIKPEQSMRYLVAKKSLVSGDTIDATWIEKMGRHEKAIQDVVTVAFPLPRHRRDFFRSTRTITEPKHEELEKKLSALSDAPDGELGVKIPQPLSVEFVSENPQLVQTFSIAFQGTTARTSGRVEAIGEDGNAETIGEFRMNNFGNMMPAMGPLNREPYVFGLKPTTSKRFRIVFQEVDRQTVLKRLVLMPAALVDRGAEKQLGRMWGTPVPPPDGYLWEPAPENLPDSSVDPGQVVNLTKHFKTNKTWRIPATSGSAGWIVMRIGMAPTGVENGPAPPQATGLEVDKMSKRHIESHFEGMIGKFLQRIPEERRKGFKRVVVDSYEVGPQNWTDDFETVFAERYGYDPIPWLPCIDGFVVGNRDRTDRFLWDWRRLVADLISENYVGGLRAACNKHGLHLWCENYGHWGFPGESLQYGAYSDHVAGEYWQTNAELGPIECRLASSSAHIYGKKTVFAESFTAGQNFTHFPIDLKARGDWCFAQGINHIVLHLAVHQPYEAVPGIVPWFGLDFNRNSTWFADFGSGWTDYLRRCGVVLKQGVHVGDVAYFFGEDTPRMNGQIDPPLPRGFDFDFINAEVLLHRMTAADGCWTLPDGKQYRILAIPEQIDRMTPELILKIEALVKDGCVLLGRPPVGSPSLKNYPQCNHIVTETAARFWGDSPGGRIVRKVGRGTVLSGMTLEEAFAELKIRPDFDDSMPSLLWTHRRDPETNVDYYFVGNPLSSPLNVEPVFRVTDRRPELWNAVDGSIVETAVFSPEKNGIKVPLSLPPSGSVFVVFRKPLGSLPGVVSFRENDEEVYPVSRTRQDDSNSNFVLAVDVLPTMKIQLPEEAAATGIRNSGQNWLFFPEHGNRWGEGHSGAGLSVGTNGVMVAEHWHGNIPPVLVWKAEKPLGADGNPTRIVLVYRNGKAELHVDGTRVAEGVASGQAVHAPDHPSPKSDFKGRATGAKIVPGVPDPVRLALLLKTPDTSRLPELSRTPKPALLRLGDDLFLENGLSGHRYEAGFADGSKKSWTVDGSSFGFAMDGNWTVTLAQKGGETKTIELPELVDLSTSEDEFVKYFSGTATYMTKFRVPAKQVDRILLELGEVARIASVRIDGKDVGILWTEPFMVDITDYVRQDTEHTLEVVVGTSWLNRMIGDEQLPDDVKDDPEVKAGRWPKWFPEGAPRPEARRVSFASHKPVNKDSSPVPAGLIGPVEIHGVRRVALP